MNECPHCGLKFTDAPGSRESCPNCGQRLSMTELEKNGGPLSLVRGYFQTIWMILTHPSAFFSKMPVRGGLGAPLAFALVTHWLGAALAYLWHQMVGATLSGYFDRFSKIAGDMADVDSPGRSQGWSQVMEAKDYATHWLWNTGSVIADPFFTIVSILFTSFFVYLGARILVTPGKDGHPREISYESAVRIVCFGMAPAILSVIPIFGWGLATLLTAIVTIIGAKEVYRIGTGRAIVVGLFPKILFLVTVFGGILIMAVALAKFLAGLL